MAFDEWLLEYVMRSKSLICLRLYSWSEGTITFGYNQNLNTAFDHGNIMDTRVIRRITGGRAIYHDVSELTYSIAVSADLVKKNGVFAESITRASAEIAKILVSYLKSQKIRSNYAPSSAPQEKNKDVFHKAPCFESFSRHEILSDDRKIIASAQRRISGAFMQHGSIKINGIQSHPALPTHLDNVMAGKKIPSLTEEEFDKQFTMFLNAFSKYFQKDFLESRPDNTEMDRINKLTAIVEKKSLDKRDNFKQIALNESL